MANRRDTFYGQLVTDADTDQLCDDLEQADRGATVDLGFVGVVLGLDVGEHTPHNLTVDVTAGTSYDPDGQRCHVPSTQTVDLSVDHLSASTAVSTSGKTKVVSLFLKFSRALSNPKTDDNGNTVYYDRAESYTFYVVQGAESSSTPTPPALLADGILLADVTLSYSQTQIIDANISFARTQKLVAITDTPHSLNEVSYSDALTTLLAIINDHVAGAADKHAATVISTTQGPVWANADNADKIAAGYVQDYVDTIVTKLAATTSSHSGAHLLGIASQTGSPTVLAASTLYDRLENLRLAANLSYAGGPTWFDLSTNPAASVEAQLDKIIVDLASSGASYGALKISCYARTTWLGGRTNPSASTWAAIDKIITDLSATTSSDDGAERIGAQASGGLSSGSVRSQLDELDTLKAALAGATFSGAVVLDGGGSIPNGDTLTVASGGKISFSSGGALETLGSATVSLAGSIDRLASLTITGTAATTAFRITQLAAGTTSSTLTVGADLYYVDTPSGGDHTYTLKSTSPAPPANTEIEFVCYSIGINRMNIQREGGAEILHFVGGDAWGSARFRFIGSSWRLVSYSGSAAVLSSP